MAARATKPRASRGKNKPPTSSEPLSEDMEKFSYWVAFVKSLFGKEFKDLDKWQVSELGVILYSFSKGLRAEYAGISKICNKNQDRTISVPCAIQIDRRNSPPDIDVKVNYVEKHGQTLSKTCPDIEQEDFMEGPPHDSGTDKKKNETPELLNGLEKGE